eukprot:CAMPEP_0194537688 /NCGR_PEP_ID=MMETSP0253-20130528/77033_1 /TAXON_ID=2966 /ORGANISM="Noctiluca scintillans" /LENGTH=65 /DNA_ID=CAMNT_0039383731 /DNA_START=524 /DNA_END=721 /DNA_ORIENTATION=+
MIRYTRSASRSIVVTSPPSSPASGTLPLKTLSVSPSSMSHSMPSGDEFPLDASAVSLAAMQELLG